METRKTFFARLEGRMSADEIRRIEFAYELGKYGHRSQTRESGDRYFEHLRGIALIHIDELHIYDPEIIISDFLHDNPEDQFLLNHFWIEKIFGGTVGRAVRIVTKPKKGDPRFRTDEERLDFYHRCVRYGGPMVWRLKLGDNLHNMRSLNSCSREKQIRKVQESRTHYLPVAEALRDCHRSHGEFFIRELNLAYSALGL